MGHIGNALGLRLSLNRQWRNSIDNSSVVLKRYYSWIVLYFDIVFAKDFLKQKGFIFSHCVLCQLSKGVEINLFIQDAFFEMYQAKLYNVLYPSKLRFKKDRLNLLAHKSKRREFVRDSNDQVLNKANFLFNNLKMKMQGRVFVFERKYFGNRKGKVILRNRARHFINKRRLFVFLRVRYYRLLGYFFKEQLRKLLQIDIYNVFIYPLSSSFMTADVILRYMVKRLEQGYKLSFLAKSLLKGYERSVLGIRFKCSGRFTRSQRANTHVFKKGRTPLNTFNMKFDYGYKGVRLKYGLCGIKLWIARL